MFLRRRSGAPISRGQAMVEFALVLPLLALLLVMAIDFGRVFFGWVGLHNAARIGAAYAAQHPLADWSDPTDPDVVAYLAQMNADAEAINCDFDPDPDTDVSFPSGTTLGSPTVVTLSCEFEVITPIMAQLMGNRVDLDAEAVFPVRTGIVGGGSGGGGGGGGGASIEREVPDLVGMSLRDARLAWDSAGFLGTFTPATGQDARLVTAPQFPTPGTVTDPTTTITVAADPPPSCGGSQKLLPKVIGLTVADARASWAGAGFPAAGFTPVTGSDDQIVTGQTETPSVSEPACADLTTTIEVTYEPPSDPLCLVPDLVGKQTNQAQPAWTAAGFTTTVQFEVPPPFKISRQDIVQNTTAFCETAVVTVAP